MSKGVLTSNMIALVAPLGVSTALSRLSGRAIVSMFFPGSLGNAPLPLPGSQPEIQKYLLRSPPSIPVGLPELWLHFLAVGSIRVFRSLP